MSKLGHIDMRGYQALPGTKAQRMPKEDGIYPVTLSTGDRTCALWKGKCWSVWCESWDPPEWDPVAMLNCRVVEWRMP